MKKKTVRKLEFFLHILTAFLLLLKGILLVNKHLYFPGLILSSLAIIVLAIIMLWKLLRISPKDARVFCYYIEAPALMLTSYIFYLESKESAAYLFFIAGILYPAVGFISSKTFKQLKKPHRSEA